MTDYIKETTTQARNFSFEELACRCRHTYKFATCQILPQTDEAITARQRLQRIRDELGIPMTINSNYRCLEYNTEVGSRPTSQHVLATAFDVSTVSMGHKKTLELVELSRLFGFRGIGLYDTFVHIDTGVGKPTVRKWDNTKHTKGNLQEQLWKRIVLHYKDV